MSTTSEGTEKKCRFCNSHIATRKETIVIEDTIFVIESCDHCHELRRYECHLSICSSCGMLVLAKKTWLYIFLRYFPLHRSWSIVPFCPCCHRVDLDGYFF